jgi:quercetin dioxygenase-like cupin family protein
MDWISGNIFVRQMAFESAGDVVEGHEHNFGHTTYVPRGSLRFELLDKENNVIKTVDKRATDGHNWVLIKEGARHRITALENNSMGHCIYSHRNAQGEVQQEYEGWTAPYE